jgi:hypothetical protein
MGTIQRLMILIGIVAGVALCAPKCQRTNFCMGCSDTVEDRCTACFNWGSGVLVAKSLIYFFCKVAIKPVVLNCKYYSGTSDNNAARTINDCQICSSTFLNWTESTKIAECQKTPLDGSCVAVKNCLTTVCSKAINGTFTTGCRMCARTYKPSGTFTGGLSSGCTLDK